MNYFFVFRTHCAVIVILARHSSSAEMEMNLSGVILSCAALSQKRVTRWTTVSKAARSSGNISPQLMFIYQLSISEINAVPLRKNGKNLSSSILVVVYFLIVQGECY